MGQGQNMNKKRRYIHLLFLLRLEALSGTNFLIAAAYNKFNIGGQYVRIGIGKGLYSLGIDVDTYCEDIAVCIMDYTFLDIALLTPTVGLESDLFSDIRLQPFPNPSQGIGINQMHHRPFQSTLAISFPPESIIILWLLQEKRNRSI